MYGVGYPVMQNGIEGRYTLVFLLVLLLAKMLATSLTIGIGGSGGVFAPSLFVGAMAGTAFGVVLQRGSRRSTCHPAPTGSSGWPPYSRAPATPRSPPW